MSHNNITRYVDKLTNVVDPSTLQSKVVKNGLRD